MKAPETLHRNLQADNNKLVGKNTNLSGRSSIDRRSGTDRRKSYKALYFLKGGVERRNWKERRYLWNMTM
jgi:hypothetical protein